jgi:cobalt-zinc-cadmium efflux system protein
MVLHLSVVALAIGLFVAVHALVLGRQVRGRSGKHVLQGMQLDEVVANLESVPGVAVIHDLHV